jgi:DNA-binding transcriptional regulator GbsR (MarR family)
MKKIDRTDIISNLNAKSIEKLLIKFRYLTNRNIVDVDDLLTLLYDNDISGNLVEELDLGTKNLLGLLYLTDEDLSVNDIVRQYDVSRQQVIRSLDILAGIGLCAVEKDAIFINESARLRPSMVKLGSYLSDLALDSSAQVLDKILKKWGEKQKVKGLTARIELLKKILKDHKRVEDVIKKAPDSVKELVLQLKKTPRIYSNHYSMSSIWYSYQSLDAVDPQIWLAERGLLWLRGFRSEMPFEVGVAMRQGKIVEDLRLDPPRLTVNELSDPNVNANGVHAFIETVDTIEDIFEYLTKEPFDTLKVGGIGIKTIKKLAKYLNKTPEEAAFFIDLLMLSNMIGGLQVSQDTYNYSYTNLFVEFLELPIEKQWHYLIKSYFVRSNTYSRYVTATKNKIKYLPCTDYNGNRQLATIKLSLISSLAAGPSNRYYSREDILQLLNFYSGIFNALDYSRQIELLDEYIYDLQKLGVLYGTTLLEYAIPISSLDFAQAESSFKKHLPKTTDDFIVQADLSIVVDGTLDTIVKQTLESIASKETKSTATVYRITQDSIYKAFTEGFTPDSILIFLKTNSRVDVPQPLEYLINDLWRKFTQITVMRAQSVIVLNEPNIKLDILNAKQLRTLDIREITPNVFISTAPANIIMSSLISNNYLPAYLNEKGELDSAEQKNTNFAKGYFEYITVDADDRYDIASLREFSEKLNSELKILIKNINSDKTNNNEPISVAVKKDDYQIQDIQIPAEVLEDMIDIILNEDIEDFDDDDFDDDDFDDDLSVPRPATIAREESDITRYLTLSIVNDWNVRICFEKGNKNLTLNAKIVQLTSDTCNLISLDDTKIYSIEQASVVWVRFLTEEEEDAVLYD